MNGNCIAIHNGIYTIFNHRMAISKKYIEISILFNFF